MKEIAVDKIRNLFEDLKRDKKTLVKILFIILILLVAAILRISSADKSSVNVETVESAGIEAESDIGSEAVTADVCVDIGGQVANPGVYQVSQGTRLYQLIEMAGGLTENADTDSINRASYVEDGEKIMIPAKIASGSSSPGEASSSGEESQSPGISSSGLVNINYASKDELKTLNGIGDVTAEKIIEYRSSKAFKSKEDIMSVDGIGSKTFEKIQDDITV